MTSPPFVSAHRQRIVEYGCGGVLLFILIRNAWITSPRITIVSTIARTRASTYSRMLDLVRARARSAEVVAALAIFLVPPV